ASTQKSDAKAEFPEALYNAGLAYQRCGKDAEARSKFEDTLKADPGFHRAKAQLALYDYAKSGDLDSAITKLDQIIRDAKFQNFNSAVKEFGRARSLDAKFFEAHMNYAAVSLSFRGYEEAEKAYRDALKLRPKEFEAHLGLALALRGQINDSNWEKMVASAQAE